MLRQALDAIDREDEISPTGDGIDALAAQHRKLAFRAMTDMANGTTYKSSASLPSLININPSALPASGDDTLTRVNKQVYIISRLAAELAASKANYEMASRFGLVGVYDPIRHMMLIGAQTVEYNKLVSLSTPPKPTN